jgi:toxin CptA
MTIAVSVVVRPSRIVMLSTCATAFAAVLAACSLLLGSHESSAALRLHISFIATICSAAAVFRAVRLRKTFHIDISGIGQIRLTQYSGMLAWYENANFALDGDLGQVVHLSRNSVLWPQCLLLRLKPVTGSGSWVVVLPDAVAGCGFAGLSVACRIIAKRNVDRKMND